MATSASLLGDEMQRLSSPATELPVAMDDDNSDEEGAVPTAAGSKPRRKAHQRPQVRARVVVHAGGDAPLHGSSGAHFTPCV